MAADAWYGCCMRCVAEVSARYENHFYKNNQDYVKAKAKQWRANNPGKKRSYDMTREARMRAGGCYTLAEELAQWDKQHHKCAVPGCDKHIASSGKDKYQVDHIFPLAKDGCNLAINLQCLCSFHNISKRARDPFEWAQTKLKLSSEDYELLTSGWLAAYEYYIRMNPHRKKKPTEQKNLFLT